MVYLINLNNKGGVVIPEMFYWAVRLQVFDPLLRKSRSGVI
jgi:hypothetical protein